MATAKDTANRCALQDTVQLFKSCFAINFTLSSRYLGKTNTITCSALADNEAACLNNK